MRTAYLVSRFPVATETFILRELNAVEDALGSEVVLCSLFAPDRPFVHPAAERWLGRHRRPGAIAALRGLVWPLATRRGRLRAVVADILRGSPRRPRRATRMLATVPV